MARRPAFSDAYRLLRSAAEEYGAEDIASSGEAALFRGFRNIRDKQSFAERAIRIVGQGNVAYFHGDLAVRVVKFVDPHAPTKRRTKA